MGNKKVALVTGGSSGIGMGIALELAGKGYDIAFTYRNNAEGASAVAAQIEALGAACRFYQIAVEELESCAALVDRVHADFGRIDAFHMDEYVGLAPDAPQGFGNVLRVRLFDRVPFGSVAYINGFASDTNTACAEYAQALCAAPIDIVCMGIGENGHIAFNDPHEADLMDPLLVKRVSLDEVCRMQQVHDGCFAKLSDVPTHAITLTVPALMRAKFHFCMVPAASKCEAVYRTVHGPIGPECPASALRLCRHANLYVDRDSGAKLAEVLYD